MEALPICLTSLVDSYGELGVFILVEFCFYFLDYPTESGMLLELSHYLSVAWKFLLGGKQFPRMFSPLWGPLSWGQSVIGPSWHFRISSSPRTLCFFRLPQLSAWREDTDFFNMTVHMTMISEAWEATELCNKWYKY